jgi:hypothetical protein
LVRGHGFDDFAEAQCATCCAETMGRPGLPAGIYFRLLLIGYFEGIESERGIAWRAADSFPLRDFLGVGLEAAPPAPTRADLARIDHKRKKKGSNDDRTHPRYPDAKITTLKVRPDTFGPKGGARNRSRAAVCASL